MHSKEPAVMEISLQDTLYLTMTLQCRYLLGHWEGFSRTQSITITYRHRQTVYGSSWYLSLWFLEALCLCGRRAYSKIASIPCSMLSLLCLRCNKRASFQEVGVLELWKLWFMFNAWLSMDSHWQVKHACSNCSAQDLQYRMLDTT